MNSSISRCASSRSGQRTSFSRPSASRISLRSGRSRSSGSRMSRSLLHGLVGGPQRPQHGLQQRRGRSRPAARRWRAAPARRLSLAAERIMMRWKLWRLLAPVGADDQPHRQRRPVLVRAQRAEVVGDALGQHRHDAVGEIDGIAALQRLAVERRAGRDVVSDVGDGDGDDEAAVGAAPRRGRRRRGPWRRAGRW